jgi:hypothetical protein
MNFEGLPQFIHHSPSGVQVVYSIKQALSLWANNVNNKQMLQKFIVPPMRTPEKLRIYWQATDGPAYFTIKSFLAFPKSREMNASDTEGGLSKFKYSLNDYPYAGQIRTSSFNSFMPEKSGIKSCFRGRRKKTIISYPKEMFLAKAAKDSICIVDENLVAQEVKLMMDDLIFLINSHIGKTDNKVVSELLVDFLIDDKKNYYISKCRSYKTDYLPMNPRFPLQNQKSTITKNKLFARGFFESIIEKKKSQFDSEYMSIDSLSKRLDQVQQKTAKIQTHKTSFLNYPSYNNTSVITAYIARPPISLMPKLAKPREENSELTASVRNLDRLAKSSHSHRKLNSCL